MNKQDRDFIAPLIAQNTTESWAEAICIAIAQLKNKEGKALQVFLNEDYTGYADYAKHINLYIQIAKLLRGEA